MRIVRLKVTVPRWRFCAAIVSQGRQRAALCVEIQLCDVLIRVLFAGCGVGALDDFIVWRLATVVESDSIKNLALGWLRLALAALD